MAGKLEGKGALVTGGSRGIGATIALRLAADGTSAGVGYRSTRAEADAIVRETEAAGGKAIAVQGDVGNDGDPARMVTQTYRHSGRPDTLVNSAGIGEYRPLEACDEASARQMFDTDVVGAMMLTKAAAAVMAEGGRVVQLASRLPYVPLPTSAVYSATKAAVVAMVHSMAKELGSCGVTVNAIAPGLIETDMTASMIKERGEVMKAATPLGRIGQPEDIAGIAAVLGFRRFPLDHRSHDPRHWRDDLRSATFHKTPCAPAVRPGTLAEGWTFCRQT